MATTNLEVLRKEVSRCQDCPNLFAALKRNSGSQAIQLPHSNPEKVQILVITEQPKILDDTPVNNKTFLAANYELTHTTAARLITTLGVNFATSIRSRSGPYYWTHHTRCPSRDRCPQERCMDKFLINELKAFPNLTTIITFGSIAYTRLLDVYRHKLGGKFNKAYFDYFYDELVQNVRKSINLAVLMIYGREVRLLALPHPSDANPAHLFLCRMKWIISMSTKAN
jgi:uracil-DNA glycosylase